MTEIIKKKIQSITNNRFYRNVTKLVSGTIIAQSLPILISPILTRIYTPEQFGELAIFISVTLIVGNIATGRYELAIVLPKTKSESISLVHISILMTSLVSALFLLVVLFYDDYLGGLSKTDSYFIYAPLVVFFIGLSNALNYYNTRHGEFKVIAMSNIFKSVFLVGAQLFFGVVFVNSIGLIYGVVLSFLIFAISQSLPNYSEIKMKKASYTEMAELMGKYRKFPLFMLPGTLLNAMSGNIMTLTIPLLFSTASLGYYSLAQRVLGAPSALIGSSISLVYTQEASEERSKTGVIIKTFDRTLLRLVVISTPIFLLLYHTMEIIFSFAFGDEWNIGAVYAKYLIPFFYVNFIVSALSTTDSIMERQHFYLFFNFLLLSSLILLVTLFEYSSTEELIIASSATMTTLYVGYGVVCRLVAKGKL